MEAVCHKCAATCTRCLEEEEVRDSCSGITSSASESLSRETTAAKYANLWHALDIHCVFSMAVHHGNSIMFTWLPFLFRWSQIRMVWLLKCSVGSWVRHNWTDVKSVTSLVSFRVRLLLLSFYISVSVHLYTCLASSSAFYIHVWECDLVRSVPED